jgi:putative inorganic carbon (hco3(-)) transporter
VARPLEPETLWHAWLSGWAWLGGDWLRVLVWLALGFTTLALLMSYSRGAMLGLAVALVVITALASRRGAFLTAVGAVVVGALLVLGLSDLLPASFADRLTIVWDYFSIFDVRDVVITPENWALVERMAHWQAAWSMYEDHQLFGVGIGNYVVAYPRYYLQIWVDPLGHAHNLYLNVLAEMGAVGLTAYLLMLVSWFAFAFVSLRRAENGLARALALGCIGVLIAGSVHNLFDNLYVHGLNVHLAIVLALSSLAGRRSAPESVARSQTQSTDTLHPTPFTCPTTLETTLGRKPS